MAYMGKAKKAIIAKELAKCMKKYDIRYTLAIRHGTTIVMSIRGGSLDFGGKALECHQFLKQVPASVTDPTARKCLSEALTALHTGNFDEGDPITDYFHAGHFVDLVDRRSELL